MTNSEALITSILSSYQKHPYSTTITNETKTITGIETFKVYILTLARSGEGQLGVYIVAYGVVKPIVDNSNYTVSINNGSLSISSSLSYYVNVDITCLSGDGSLS